MSRRTPVFRHYCVDDPDNFYPIGCPDHSKAEQCRNDADEDKCPSDLDPYNPKLKILAQEGTVRYLSRAEQEEYRRRNGNPDTDSQRPSTPRFDMSHRQQQEMDRYRDESRPDSFRGRSQSRSRRRSCPSDCDDDCCRALSRGPSRSSSRGPDRRRSHSRHSRGPSPTASIRSFAQKGYDALKSPGLARVATVAKVVQRKRSGHSLTGSVVRGVGTYALARTAQGFMPNMKLDKERDRYDGDDDRGRGRSRSQGGVGGRISRSASRAWSAFTGRSPSRARDGYESDNDDDRRHRRRSSVHGKGRGRNHSRSPSPGLLEGLTKNPLAMTAAAAAAVYLIKKTRDNKDGDKGGKDKSGKDKKSGDSGGDIFSTMLRRLKGRGSDDDDSADEREKKAKRKARKDKERADEREREDRPRRSRGLLTQEPADADRSSSHSRRQDRPESDRYSDDRASRHERRMLADADVRRRSRSRRNRASRVDSPSRSPARLEAPTRTKTGNVRDLLDSRRGEYASDRQSGRYDGDGDSHRRRDRRDRDREVREPKRERDEDTDDRKHAEGGR